MACYHKRLCHLAELLPGMEIGQMVVSSDRKYILNEGTQLTASQIQLLHNWDVPAVYIRVDAEAIDQACLSLVAENEPDHFVTFCREYEQTVEEVQHLFTSVRYFREVPLQKMRELVDHSIDMLVDTVGIINYLDMVRRSDEYTFRHSVNVAIISGILGKWLGYCGTKLKDLILAGLLHDLGKAHVPLEILNKPGKLTDQEMEVMKTHTILGYELLCHSADLDMGIRLGVLQHHERMDGTGYPLGISGKEIHPYARIIAVADIYDAMTSDRTYRRKVTPFAVVETVVESMFQKLDPEVCASFLNNLRSYFVGNIVRLSDGREAEVIYLRDYLATRPIVRTQNGDILDLEIQKELSIIELTSE